MLNVDLEAPLDLDALRGTAAVEFFDTCSPSEVAYGGATVLDRLPSLADFIVFSRTLEFKQEVMDCVIALRSERAHKQREMRKASADRRNARRRELRRHRRQLAETLSASDGLPPDRHALPANFFSVAPSRKRHAADELPMTHTFNVPLGSGGGGDSLDSWNSSGYSSPIAQEWHRINEILSAENSRDGANEYLTNVGLGAGRPSGPAAGLD